MNNKLILNKISFSPFIHSNNSIQKAMVDVLISLIPAVICSIYYFGPHVVFLLISTILSALFFELISIKIMKKDNSIFDCSAIVTAVLLTLTLPPTTSLLISIIGSFIAIVIVKQLFGGIGCNIFNPALAARGILLISFSVQLTNWAEPFNYIQKTDTISAATPLILTKEISRLVYLNPSDAVNLLNQTINKSAFIYNLLIGNTSGSLGETSAVALFIGGIFLILKKRIHVEIPLFYISTVFTISMVFGFIYNLGIFFPIIHILSGGLFIGSIFMATDWVTKPLTKKSRIIYAICLGVITMIIRLKGNYPEGVLFSILIMNMFVPIMDRHLKNRIFGKK